LELFCLAFRFNSVAKNPSTSTTAYRSTLLMDFNNILMTASYTMYAISGLMLWATNSKPIVTVATGRLHFGDVFIVKLSLGKRTAEACTTEAILVKTARSIVDSKFILFRLNCHVHGAQTYYDTNGTPYGHAACRIPQINPRMENEEEAHDAPYYH